MSDGTIGSARHTAFDERGPNAHRFSPPRWLLLALGLALVWIYTHGMSALPLKWEEPRRALIAMEMIESGDYVVPHLLGRPYRNKPPMQNWLIVLAAGNGFDRVGAVAVRTVSVLSWFGIALFVWRLGVGRGPDVLPVVVFLTFGTVVQHGWAGEVDAPFCFWVTAALATFELGRRHRAPWVQWTLAQALVAAGVLTKGLAPLFFYPPVLLLAWRRRDVPFSGPAFVTGLGLATALVGAWGVPYAMRAPLDRLAAGLAAEVTARTVEPGAAAALMHLATYPLLVAGVLLPWSLLLFAHTPRRWPEAVRRAAADPLLALASTSVAWGLLVYAFVPGARGRYLIPLLPWAAILFARLLESTPLRRDVAIRRRDRAFRVHAAVLTVLWIGYAGGVARRDLDGPPLVAMTVAGLAVVAALAFARSRGGVRNTVAALVMLGLLYGFAHRTVSEARESRRGRPFHESATRLVAGLDPGTPVVLHPQVDRRAAFAAARATGRVPRLDPPSAGPFVWVAPTEVAGPAGAEPLDAAGPYATWRITDPAALRRAGLGDALAPATRRRLEAARRRYDKDPRDLDALLDLARATARVGDDATAEALLTRGLARAPDTPRLLRYRGENRIRLGRFDAAAADLERAAAILASRPAAAAHAVADPPFDDRPPGRSGGPVPRVLGDALDAFGDPAAAKDTRQPPGASLWRNVHFHLGLAHYLRGAFDAAWSAWTEVGRDYPEDVASRYWAALADGRRRRDPAPLERLEPADATAAAYAAAVEALCRGDTGVAAPLLRRLAEAGGTPGPARWESLAARVDLGRPAARRDGSNGPTGSLEGPAGLGLPDGRP